MSVKEAGRKLRFWINRAAFFVALAAIVSVVMFGSKWLDACVSSSAVVCEIQVDAGVCTKVCTIGSSVSVTVVPCEGDE